VLQLTEVSGPLPTCRDYQIVAFITYHGGFVKSETGNASHVGQWSKPEQAAVEARGRNRDGHTAYQEHLVDGVHQSTLNDSPIVAKTDLCCDHSLSSTVRDNVHRLFSCTYAYRYCLKGIEPI
jgi:hypothetical protein